METNAATNDDKIKVIDARIQVERDPAKRQELQKRKQILLYNKEIEQIRMRIQQLA